MTYVPSTELELAKELVLIEGNEVLDVALELLEDQDVVGDVDHKRYSSHPQCGLVHYTKRYE